MASRMSSISQLAADERADLLTGENDMKDADWFRGKVALVTGEIVDVNGGLLMR